MGLAIAALAKPLSNCGVIRALTSQCLSIDPFGFDCTIKLRGLASYMRPILITPLLLLASYSAQAQPAIISPGDGFDVARYSVVLRPDMTTTAVAGVETITLDITSDQLKHVAFTTNALKISGATVNDKPVEAISSKDSIAFTLPNVLERGRRITLRFKFEGTPARGVTAAAGGLYTS